MARSKMFLAWNIILNYNPNNSAVQFQKRLEKYYQIVKIKVALNDSFI